MSDADIVEVSDRETSFSSHESDAEHLYDAIEILKEKKGQYLIKWDGVDPATGKPWPDSWANKRDCTDDIVATWKLKKAQKKKEQQERKAKKVAKTRASTVSRRTQASKASTSRQTASLAPSSRSLRSRTAVPGDYEEQYESISRTPGKRRAVASLSDDDAPPPSARPAKKRKLLPPERRSRSPVELVADSSDDDGPSNGKGKAVARLSKSATPLPRKPGRPPKNVSLLQRQRDKGDDDFGDKTPAKPSRGTSLVQRRNDKQDDRSADDPSTKPRKSIIQRQRDKQDHSFFDDIPAKPPQSASLFRSQREKKDDNWGEPPKSTSRQRYKTPDSEHSDAVHQPTKFPHPSTPTRRRSSFDRHISQSQILSPNGQARLAQFDDEIANPTQQPQFSSEKQPLFLPGSSEEPTLPPSRSHSPQQPKSPQYHPSPPQPESPQYRDSPSPYRSRSLSPGPRIPSPVAPSPPPRTINPRHASRRPADDSYRDGDIPETQSPPTSPAVALPSPKRSLISKAMKPRSKTSSFYGPQSPRTTKPVGPITLMTAAQFTAQVQKDTVGDGEASLPSSIEQFSSPAKKQKGPSRVVDKKGKGRQLDEEDENEETDVLRERMIALADKARAERRAQLAEYAGTEPKEKTTLSQILKQRAQEGPSLSQTDSDIAMSQPQAVVDAPVQPERREEEENTQDVMAYYNIVTDPPNGVVDHSDVLQAMNGVAEDRPHSESDARGRSVDRETDAEGSLDVDIAERSAWNKEHASQQHLFEQNGDTSLEHAGDTSQDRMRDDSMDLLYPPDDDPVSEEPLASERIPAEEPPPAPNGYAAQPQSRSKSRSTSARPKKSLDDADLELPPTASTNENSPERGKNGLEPGEIPEVIRPLMDTYGDLMTLLNVKSEENIRLETLLADQRAMLEAERAKNTVLQERVTTLELQSVSSDVGLTDRLKALEDLLAAERAERDSARKNQAEAEQQRELFREIYGKASQLVDEKTAENKELEKRCQIAEETTREGIATIKATFDLREVTLKADVRDWRNQAIFLREQAIRTQDPDLRRRAAEQPELVVKRDRLLDEIEIYQDKLENLEDDKLVKDDEINALKEQLLVVSQELDDLKAAALRVNGDDQVLRCRWRSEATNVPCPVLCLTQEDLNFHASMHVKKTLVDPASVI